MSQQNGKNLIRKTLSRQNEWEPFATKFRATNLYGLSPFGYQIMSETEKGFQKQVLGSIDRSLLPLLDFLEKDELNRHFFGEIGTGIMEVPERVEKLLKFSGCGRQTRIVDVYDGILEPKSKKNRRTIWRSDRKNDLTIEWEHYPKELKNNLPLPLVDKLSIKKLHLPAYLFREEFKPKSKVLNAILIFPARYDYQIEDFEYDAGDIRVDYNHAALGPLTAKVNRLSLDEIKKGVIDESEIYNSVRFESYGVDTSMTSILGSVQEYRNNIKKQKTLEDRVEVMGYDSLKDYLICVCK